MQNCVECSYFLLDNRNRKEYECLECCCLISEQMRFWAVQTEITMVKANKIKTNFWMWMIDV
jgi:hypothetical protein